MNKFYFLYILILCNFSCTKETSYELNGVLIAKEIEYVDEFYNVQEFYFHDSLNGYIVSEYRKLFITHDGGKTWLLSNEFPRNIRLVNSTDGTVIFVITESTSSVRKEMYRSLNSGQSWSQLSDLQTGCNKLEFFNSTDGWVTDEYDNLLWTTNAGITWTSTNIDNDASLLHFYDINNGFQIDGTNFQVTFDGGLNWVTTATGVSSRDIQFFDSPDVIYLINEGMTNIKRSFDRGITWNTVSEFSGFYGLDFAVNRSGNIGLQTAAKQFKISPDQGNNWSDLKIYTTEFGYVQDYKILDDNTLIMLCKENNNYSITKSLYRVKFY